MKGTEKQVQWATKIQKKFYREVKTKKERYERWLEKFDGEPKKRAEALLPIIRDAVLNAELHDDDAVWWIENRDYQANLSAVLNRAAEEKGVSP